MSAPALSPVTAPGLSAPMFARFRELIFQKTGIHVRDGKEILIANRLRKRMVHLGLASYEDYYQFLTSGKPGQEELANFIDAVSTNETYFFRESNHFTVLTQTILPELVRSRKHLRLWSAGCSTGEEVYTLAIIIGEAARLAGEIGRAHV
jgi:chemotaxis protein methyltransferase CheR